MAEEAGSGDNFSLVLSLNNVAMFGAVFIVLGLMFFTWCLVRISADADRRARAMYEEQRSGRWEVITITTDVEE